MKKIAAVLLLFLSGSAFSQSTSYTVSYDGMPACNTTFTISDTNKRMLGTGKSDESGTFSCDYDVENIGVFVLKSTPDKGKGWELQIPLEAIEASGTGYDIALENVEAMMNEAFEMQNEMLGGAEEQNEEMNSESGSNMGSEELGMIGGIVKVGQKMGDAQFKLISASIAKSCSDVPNPVLKKPSNDKKGNANEQVAGSKPVKAKGAEEDDDDEEFTSEKAPKNSEKNAEKTPEKEEPTISKKEQKEMEEAAAAAEAARVKEEERLEKERQEQERIEQERIAAEEEAAAEDLNFTPEELAQMSDLDLSKKEAWCEAAIGRNKMKLSVRGGLLKPDEKTEIENRIKELETASATIKAESDRRKAEKEAKKEKK